MFFEHARSSINTIIIDCDHERHVLGNQLGKPFMGAIRFYSDGRDKQRPIRVSMSAVRGQVETDSRNLHFTLEMKNCSLLQTQHSHSDQAPKYHVGVVRQGAFEIRDQGLLFQMPRGAIFIVNDLSTFKMSAVGTSTAIMDMMLIDVQDFKEKLFHDLSLSWTDLSKHPQAMALNFMLRSLFADAEENPLGSNKFYIFINALIHSICDSMLIAKKTDNSYELLQLVDELIEKNFSDCEMSQETAVVSLGISARTLRRKLLLMGTSFPDRLQRFRIGRSMFLLRETRLSIEKIASECGFGNIVTFRRNFKKITNTSPNEYRKREFIGLVVNSR